MSYYIYKYVNNNDIIEYIGQTTDLDRRIKDHTKDKLKNFHGQIYYFECQNKTAMDSWEYFLIQKYHPKYNVVFNNTQMTINIDEPEWKLYMETTTKNNIINFSDYLKPSITTDQEIPKITNDSDVRIISGPKRLIFKCRHCRTVFETGIYYKTKTMYGTRCPSCSYAAYSKG